MGTLGGAASSGQPLGDGARAVAPPSVRYVVRETWGYLTDRPPVRYSKPHVTVSVLDRRVGFRCVASFRSEDYPAPYADQVDAARMHARHFAAALTGGPAPLAAVATTRDTAAYRSRRLDLMSPDHWPTCPRCHDLCDPGAKRCSCGGRL